MTQEGKHYWVRRKGTANQPGQKHGLLSGKNRRGQSLWTQKPAIACVYLGGQKLNQFLLEHPDCESVEVVKKGVKKYHGRTVENWAPVAPREDPADECTD